MQLHRAQEPALTFHPRPTLAGQKATRRDLCGDPCLREHRIPGLALDKHVGVMEGFASALVVDDRPGWQVQLVAPWPTDYDRRTVPKHRLKGMAQSRNQHGQRDIPT